MKVKLECPYDFMDPNIIKKLNLSNDPECLIVNPGIDKFLDEKYFNQFKNLKVVGTPSTGVNHMDINYLKEKICRLAQEEIKRVVSSHRLQGS